MRRDVFFCFFLTLPFLSKPQPNLNTMVGFDTKITLHPPPHTQNSILAISQLLLTQFWWNFKGRFLWTSRTDSTCHGDICPGNICPRDICPNQEYLSSYWTDFDETLKIGSWEHQEQIPTVTVTFVQGPKPQCSVWDSDLAMTGYSTKA